MKYAKELEKIIDKYGEDNVKVVVDSDWYFIYANDEKVGGSYDSHPMDLLFSMINSYGVKVEGA